MTDLWQQAIASAERALRGDVAARLKASVDAVKLRGDPDPLLQPNLGRNLAYLTSLLEALGLRNESRALLENVVGRLHWDPKSLSLPGDVRNELAVVLADRGLVSAAVTVLSPTVTLGAKDDQSPATTRSLANLAAIKLRLGNLAGATSVAEQALSLSACNNSLLERLEIELLAKSVLAETARQRGRHAEADELVHALARTARQLVHLLGSGHTQSLAALITLARAEFRSAMAADDRERWERAADVLAVAAQKASATLGPRHPLSLSSLVSLATTEFEAAQALSDERRLDGARAMVVAAAQRSAGERNGADSTPVPSPPAARAETSRRPPVRPTSTVPETLAHVSRAPGQRAPEEAAPLRFGVLGPVRAWRGADSLPTGSPQQRALLAALLLREGRTATAGELIDALWGEEPPTQALAAVRTYASRLRKVLSPGVLVSESGGYALRSLGDGALDLAVAQDLAADAERARSTGDLCHARALLNKALSLWDGEVLASVPGPYAETQRTRLEEWRLQLIESRLDMDLEQGCHAEAISELTALTAAHPLR
ncbi:BTAD domain-containing putative transcriptional regulator, partial [Streptomyces phaeochromogenes]